jgi:branched-subunit amino acid aminotransferase/4-amino-4-deoxychorismate lyase
MTFTLLDDVQKIASHECFAITTSLRWDPDRSLLDSHPHALPLRYHQARLVASASAFKLHHLQSTLSGEAGFEHLQQHVTKHTSQLQATPHKLTLNCRADGTIDIVSSPALPPLYSFLLSAGPPPPPSAVEAMIYVAPHTTRASPFTAHKTVHRPMYTAVRMAAGIPAAPPTSEEVLLYNEKDQVTEASLSTVYFWRNAQWVTPASSCGGNCGASRMLSLEQAWCVEDVIMRKDVRVDEVVALSNGVRGYWFAVVRQLSHERT